MKKILIFAILSNFFCQLSFSQSMTSINNYISNNSNWLDDPISTAYVLKRCGAVYIYASALTSNKDQIEAFKKASDKSSLFAHEVLSGEMDSSKATDIVFNALDKIIMNYKNDGDASYAASGEYTTKNYIGEDLQTCKGIVESIS